MSFIITKNTDGHYFVKEVIKKGSKVIVVKNNFKVPKNNLINFQGTITNQISRKFCKISKANITR